MGAIAYVERSTAAVLAFVATTACLPTHLSLQEVLPAVSPDLFYRTPSTTLSGHPSENALLDSASGREIGVLPRVVPEARSGISPDVVQTMPSCRGVGG